MMTGGVRITHNKSMAVTLGVERAVIESLDLEPDGPGGEGLIARVRPETGMCSRCPGSGRSSWACSFSSPRFSGRTHRACCHVAGGPSG